MTYLLPRVFIVAIAWAITCAVISNFWHGAGATTYAAAGLSWAAAGTMYFGYLRKLKRDMKPFERSRYNIGSRTT